jgi:hypothetical protein
MKELDLHVVVDGDVLPRKFKVKRMINAGYTGRDARAVLAHIEEMSRLGVPAPSSVPLLFPVLSKNVTTENRVEVIGDHTSGEVEFVLLVDGDNVLIGVGSDHTDRDLERDSIVKSKQICPNVLSQTLWRYEDVKPGWDDLIIQSWVREKESDESVLYQEAPLSSLIHPEELIRLVESRIPAGESTGLVVYSGTIPTLAGKPIYGVYFRGVLIDSRLNRRLVCEYWVQKLEPLF